MEVTQLGFDYGLLAPEVRNRVQEAAHRIHELERKTSEAVIEIGGHLSAVREEIGWGRFDEWVDREFQWSRRTAYNFIKVYEVFGGSAIIAQSSPTALIALASGSVPEHIREGFEVAAEAGRPVRHKDVKEAVEAHREQQHRATVEVDAETGEILDDDDEDIVEGEIVDPANPSAFEWTPQPTAAPPAKHVHVSSNSGENEWYTPPQYIEAAREVMGRIDLDPASNPLANEWIRADTIYTKDNNGLAQEWHGRVWMNPPYAQPLITNFAEKLVEEYKAGRVSEAIVLVNNATETRWFQTLAGAATAVCFSKGRIKYLDATGTPANTPLQGQAFLYFGRDDFIGTFDTVFERFGVVL